MKTKCGKIAFIHPDLGIGGAERLILDMANALNDEYEILFLVNHCDPKHSFDEVKNGNYNVQVFGDWIPTNIFGKFHALFAYLRMVYLVLTYLLFYRKEYNVDLHIVDLVPIAIPFLKLANQKALYYCHHPDLLATTRENILKKIYRAPIDWIEAKATKASVVTLVNSEYTKSVFEETFPDINQQLQVLYPTISSSVVELISKIDMKITISDVLENIPNNSITFLSINRFHPAKKLEMAIEAMSCLKSSISELKWNQIYFVMVGGYDPRSDINTFYFSQLQQLTERLDLENKIIFVKSPSDLIKAQLLKVCSCLVYTPVKEHFGIVPLEAMMAEKPVIACNSGGPRETVEDGKTGYLCEPDSDSLAKFMSKIITDNNFEEMGKYGKQRLQNNFSNQLFCQRLKKIIRHIRE